MGFNISSLRVIGGGVRGDIWMQIISDITGKKNETLEYPQERGAIGAAYISFIGLVLIKDFKSLKELIRPYKFLSLI